MRFPEVRQWLKSDSLESLQYKCGYCGSLVASEEGYEAQPSGNLVPAIYICHLCNQPSYVGLSGIVRNSIQFQIPAPAFGQPVTHTPELVGALYDEARRCLQVSAYTASVLCARKLLMNIAVSRGAKPGQPFVHYVDFLQENGYLPPDGKEWADLIRTKGNEATHEIALMSAADARELVTFLEMLLKFIYEYPARAKAQRPGS